MNTRYVVDYDKARRVWTVTSVVEHYGKIFKNSVGEATTKAGAEYIADRARSAP